MIGLWKWGGNNNIPSFNRDTSFKINTSFWRHQNHDLIQLPIPILQCHSMKHQYIRIIVPRFEVYGMKNEGEIAL